MTQPAPEPDEPGWHKRFAMRCSNRGWDLSEQTRDAAQDREMLDVAHASAWHWAQIGTELHRMRATMLLAQVHASLAMGASALAFAEEMRRYFTDRETSDWELALMHAIYAHAAYAAGLPEQHQVSYREAAAALDAIADEEDRQIVLKTFRQVPPP